jgi:hypothetical protein
MDSAQTRTMIASMFIHISCDAFQHRVILDFGICLALAGAREWPTAPSEPRTGAVQLPPRRQPSHTGEATALRVLRGVADLV